MRRVTSVETPLAHLVGPGKLKVVNGQLAYSTGEGTPLRLDPETLRAVYCYGAVSISDEALRTVLEHDVQLAFLSAQGMRCRGRLVRDDSSKTTLRLLQHGAFANPAAQREWAARVVEAKIDSQLHALRHYRRHRLGLGASAAPQMEAARHGCASAALDQLRGLEGTASAAWFAVLGELMQPPWRFEQRNRRPPRDPVNALLSLGYTFLLARVRARCEAEGLEANLGALHEYRPGRPSLVCDLMEPLRVPAVDRWVIAACNQAQVSPADFVEEKGGILLQPGCFAGILRLWETHWMEQEQEKALDAWLGEFLSWLRRFAPPEAADGAVEDG